MFDIGLGELLLVFVVALVFLDVKQLPTLARSCGKMLGQLQQFVQQTRIDDHNQNNPDDERKL